MACRLNAFSDLNSAVKAICTLQTILRSKLKEKQEQANKVSALNHARLTVMKLTRTYILGIEYETVLTGKLCKSGTLAALNPFIDDNGVMRVGGRLQNSHLSFEEKHPIILPKSHI